MTTGEKIKKLRKKKHMTQSELVGNEITRNMLSRIENGQANPSLESLMYLAHRLGVPVGYLLAEDSEDLKYERAFIIDEIKLAFKSGNYRIAAKLCEESELSDDEIGLIAAESLFSVAVEEFDEGHLHTACAYFDKAIIAADKTTYHTQHIKAASTMYFDYMRELSPNLYSNVYDDEFVEHYCAMNIDFCRYMYAVVGVENGHTTFAKSYVAAADSETDTALHLGARIDMANGNYRLALTKLRQILTNRYKVRLPVLYATFADIEHCSRELNDFKSAYEYSSAKVGLLQKMLADE